jgi:probable F420-dependent oxidoreductase
MDWGIHLPHLGRQVTREIILEFAKESERLGAHSVWVSDHLCWPADIESKYPYSDDGSFAPTTDMGWLEAIGTLTFVAACTENIRLGTSVLILPYRPPVLFAKQLATLDVLSGGRLIFGAGVGWMAEEAEVLGMPWDKRGKRSDEYLEMFEALFSDAEPSYSGDFYSIPKVGFEPKPIQQPLPVWIGGNTGAAFRRTARFGHAFHAAFEPLEVVKAGWDGVIAACEKIGRDPSEVRLSLRMFLDPAMVMPSEKSIAGSKDQMLEMIAKAKGIGIDHIVIDPVARGGAAGRLDAVRQFMEDVAPHA